MCCKGNLYAVTSGHECCDDKAFAKKKEICCQGQVYNKRRYSCCGNSVMEKSKSYCCGDEIITRSTDPTRCCGKSRGKGRLLWLCINTILSLNSAENSHYRTSFAQQKPLKATRYDPTKGESCCANNQVAENGSKCCGSKIVPESRFCCRPRNGTKSPVGFVYNPATSICCRKVSEWKSLDL